VGQFTEPEGIVQARQRYGDYSRDESREQGLESVSISGPFGGTGEAAAETASRHQVLTCQPARRAEEEPCARSILSRLARRAYRRAPTSNEIATLVGFYKTGRRDGTFSSGLQLALERLLTDPSFLFRIERDPEGTARDTAYRLTDLELASRLSFFLWSSIP